MFRRMFGKLTDFGYTRTPLQAVGFYLAFAVLGVVSFYLFYTLLYRALETFPGGIAEVMSRTPIHSTKELAQLFSTIYCLILSTALVAGKGYLKQPKYILVVIASSLFGLLGGVFIGVIPPAYFTTRRPPQQPIAPKVQDWD